MSKNNMWFKCIEIELKKIGYEKNVEIPIKMPYVSFEEIDSVCLHYFYLAMEILVGNHIEKNEIHHFSDEVYSKIRKQVTIAALSVFSITA